MFPSLQSVTVMLPLISQTTKFFKPILVSLQGLKHWDSTVQKRDKIQFQSKILIGQLTTPAKASQWWMNFFFATYVKNSFCVQLAQIIKLWEIYMNIQSFLHSSICTGFCRLCPSWIRLKSYALNNEVRCLLNNTIKGKNTNRLKYGKVASKTFSRHNTSSTN